jgi:dTDP-4-amino-4,6-dideoxygalactose transaminase
MRTVVDTVEEFWTWDRVVQSRAQATAQSLQAFKTAFGRYVGVDADQIYLMPSGHQGLEWLLRARFDSRRSVLVPAFNCSVVQDAIAAAGLRPQLYDFLPEPGIFDWQRIIDETTPDVGVLVVTHYFGVPVDFRPVLDHCARHNILVIEDCAHTLGASIGGQPVGTLGDAAIFSFNYDKPISLGWGGVSVVNRADAFNLNLSTGFLVPPVEDEIALLRQFVAAMVERRRMIPYQSLFLTRMLRRLCVLRSRPFRKPAEVCIGAVQAELGQWCLAQYSRVVQARNRNAETLAGHIPQQTWPVQESINSAWIKQKVHVPDQQQQRSLCNRLQRRGIRAGNFNWPRLIGGQGSETYPHAFSAATNWIDVPVHQNLTAAAMGHLIDSFKKAS